MAMTLWFCDMDTPYEVLSGDGGLTRGNLGLSALLKIGVASA